ncbi:MAG: T9SS type A sorting domain-containing protein [Bacteroidia bacterium]
MKLFTFKLSILFIIFFVIFIQLKSVGQNINVTASGGTLNATYTTLKGVFDAVNAGTHTGTILALVVSNTTEIATATLNASGSGAANYSSLNIQASGGVNSTISGTIAGAPIIILNGADNVTIDGINASGNYLIIANYSTSNTAGTSTIKFINDASNNLITNCNIQGSETVTISGLTNGGTIWFSTGTTTGNDNNTISYSDIGPAGINLPYRAIWANGTASVSSTILNSNININNCNIFDYFSPTSISRGIEIYVGNSDWTIANNKFYQTSTCTQTTGDLHNAIRIDASSTYSGNNFVISGNTIGFSSSNGTGVYTLTGSTNSFVPIDIASVGSGAITSIQGNTITAITQTTARAGTTNGSSLILIRISSGAANIGNSVCNIFGGSNAITHTCTAAGGGGDVLAFCGFGNGNINFTGNTISNFSLISSSAALSFYGIYSNTNSSLTNTFSNNTIGASASNSISNTANFSFSKIIGIYNLGSQCIATGNIIRNFTLNAGNSGTAGNSSLIGILNNASNAANHQISGNTIYALINTESSAFTGLAGIHYQGSNSGSNSIYGNKIYSLSLSSTNESSDMRGINIASGKTTIYNNMVSFGYDDLGNNLNKGINIAGIYDFSGTNNYYFNSVYIGGNVNSSGNSNTYAFRSDVTNNIRIIKNNIFYNGRLTNSLTGGNYAIKVSGTGTNPTGLTINNNDYYYSGSGAYMGQYNGLINSLNAWKTAIGQDANSVNVDPLFTNVTGNAANMNMYINAGNAVTLLESGGAVIAGISTDIDGTSRPGPSGSTLGGGTIPDIGADEFDGNRPCSGTPADATLTVGYSPVCSGSLSSLSLGSYSSLGGLTFQWKTSTTLLGSYTNVIDGSGATTTSYGTGLITQNVYYLCTVTCPYSSSSVNSNIGNISLAHTWSGATNSNWSTGTNWNCGAMPSATDNVVISSGAAVMPVLVANSVVNDLKLETGSVLYLNGNALTLNGTITGAGKFAGSNSSGIIAATNIGSIIMDQSSSSNASLLNLTVNDNSSATLGSALNLYGTLNIGGTLNLNSQNLVLKSNASTTARIAQLTGTLTNATNITMERYVQGGYRRSRLMSCPIQSQTLNNWRTYFHVSGPNSLTPSGSIGGVNGNGYDWTLLNSSSLFKYNETTLGDVNNGWEGCTGAISSYTLDKGAGYRVLIRGDRTIGNSLIDGTTSPVRNPFTISTTGSIYSGSFTLNSASSPFSLNYTVGGNGIINDGWNLVGNPYPSQISWDNIHDAGRLGSGPYSGTYFSNINQTVYVFNPASNTYLSYNAISNAGTLTNGIIESGQAFFIKADAASPSLSFDEVQKTALSPVGATLKTSAINELHIQLKLDSSNYDDFILKSINGAHKNLDAYDILKIDNPDINLSAIDELGNNISLNCVPEPTENEEIKLNISCKNEGKLNLNFSNFDNFITAKEIWLIDAYLNKKVLINQYPNYSFSVTTNANSKGNNRFKLQFKNTATNIAESNSSEPHISIFPNPIKHVLNITIPQFNETNAGYIYELFNSTGIIILQGNITQNDTQIDTNILPNGVYFIKITNNESSTSTIKKIIK